MQPLSEINFKTSNMFATLGVGTQGVDLDNWVTLYTVQWSEDGEAWVTYQEDGHDKVLNYFGILISLTILFSVSVRLSHQSADLSFGLSSLNVCSSFVLSCITDHHCRSLREIQIDSP